ncbi:MAG: helix-turn-helix transcriptional regulator [Gemmatimonadota bacterium]
MREPDDARTRALVTVVLLLVVIGGVVDLILDSPSRLLSAHVLLELALVLVSLGLAVHLWREWRSAERSAVALREALTAKREERDAWRRSARVALRGLGEAIDAQFEAWGLTPTEREVALLLLKGHSHKRAARLTSRSERTVRQHAGTVYRKAGLSGRAELSAFFLEGLMLPDAGGADAEAPGRFDRTSDAAQRAPSSAGPASDE